VGVYSRYGFVTPVGHSRLLLRQTPETNSLPRQISHSEAKLTLFLGRPFLP
jgi:hypothetical protein